MDEEFSQETPARGLGYGGWAAVYLPAMAAATAAYGFGLVSGRYGYLIMFAPLVLVPAMTRAQLDWLRRLGASSPAMKRYGRNMLIALFAYLMAFMGAAWFRDQASANPAMALTAALVATLPTLGMIWTIVNYLSQETDEYLRERAVRSALFGLFLVLAAGTFWGFVQMFGLARTGVSSWVFPVWAIGLGISNFWQLLRQ